MNSKQTTQNRLIIFGLFLSTVLIVAIAVFTTMNIQKNLNESYHNFGQVISKTLAIESADLIKNAPEKQYENILKEHSDLILKSNKDINYISFSDKEGNLILKTENSKIVKNNKSNISVTSPMGNKENNLGFVTVGLSSGIIDKLSSTTRASILFEFAVVWLVFAFVVLINTYLITRELKILQNGVKRISSKEFGVKIEAKDVSDEVQELFNAFNDMSNKLHLYEESNVEQLTLEKNKLQAVLMSIVNGVVVCDNNDIVTLINEHAKELLELQDDQLLNTNIKNYVDSDGNYCFTEKIDEYKNLSMQERASKPVVFNVKLDDKTLKTIISPMFTQNRDYVGYIIVLIDITKEAEMDVMKSQFISNVSHELRTPVTVLRSYIDTLYNYGSDFDYESQKEFIGTLNTEIIRLQNMVNDILDFSRLDSNAKIEKSENDISQLVDYCVNQVKPLLKEHNLTIVTQKEDNIPQINCNYDAIARALTNYLSNAVKYAPENSSIQVKLYKEDENNQVVVTVHDDGIGVAPEYQKKIFERFYRVENKTHSVKGTGLGLHLVKTTIEKHHHGHVFVNSQPNQGATFGFSLPIVDYEEDDLV
jgi:two-component system sensor histidine kinase NblS